MDYWYILLIFTFIIGTSLGIIRAIIEALYYVAQIKIFYQNNNNLLHKKPWTILFLSTFYGSILYFITFIFYACYKNFEIKVDTNIIFPSLYSGILNVSISSGLLNLCAKYSSAIITSCMFTMNVATSLLFLKIFTNEKLFLIQYILCIPLILSSIFVIISPLFDSKKKISITNNNTTLSNNQEETI